MSTLDNMQYDLRLRGVPKIHKTQVQTPIPQQISVLPIQIFTTRDWTRGRQRNSQWCDHMYSYWPYVSCVLGVCISQAYSSVLLCVFLDPRYKKNPTAGRWVCSIYYCLYLLIAMSRGFIWINIYRRIFILNVFVNSVL